MLGVLIVTELIYSNTNPVILTLALTVTIYIKPNPHPSRNRLP